MFLIEVTKITNPREVKNGKGGDGVIHSGAIKAMLGSDCLPIPTRQYPSWINERSRGEKVGHTKTRDPRKQAVSQGPKPGKLQEEGL